MNLEVEMVYQSPCTPVEEVAYLVKITDMESRQSTSDNDEKYCKLIKFLEEKSIELRRKNK